MVARNCPFADPAARALSPRVVNTTVQHTVPYSAFPSATGCRLSMRYNLSTRFPIHQLTLTVSTNQSPTSRAIEQPYQTQPMLLSRRLHLPPISAPVCSSGPLRVWRFRNIQPSLYADLSRKQLQPKQDPVRPAPASPRCIQTHTLEIQARRVNLAVIPQSKFTVRTPSSHLQQARCFHHKL
jgi:hypothetical protein